MRHERKPRLEDQGNDTRPVKDQTRCEVAFHIPHMDMLHNKGERVYEREDKEGIRDPSVEDLQLLVGDSSK